MEISAWIVLFFGMSALSHEKLVGQDARGQGQGYGQGHSKGYGLDEDEESNPRKQINIFPQCSSISVFTWPVLELLFLAY